MQMVCLNREAVISLYPLPSPLTVLTSSSSTCQGPLQKGCGLSAFLAFCPVVQGMGFRSSEVCLCPKQCAQTSELGLASVWTSWHMGKVWTMLFAFPAKSGCMSRSPPPLKNRLASPGTSRAAAGPAPVAPRPPATPSWSFLRTQASQ